MMKIHMGPNTPIRGIHLQKNRMNVWLDGGDGTQTEHVVKYADWPRLRKMKPEDAYAAIFLMYTLELEDDCGHTIQMLDVEDIRAGNPDPDGGRVTWRTYEVDEKGKSEEIKPPFDRFAVVVRTPERRIAVT